MYQHPSPSPVWATPAMFAHMSDQAHDPWDFITVGMAVLSTTLLLRVGEAASIHLADISTTRRVSFFHSKRAGRWVTTSLGARGEALCCALAKCPQVRSRSQYVPIAIGSDALKLSMCRLLSGSGAQCAGWHSWRRMGAALLAWAGAAVWVSPRWGRWLSERQAQYYSSPLLHWSVHFPIDLPSPTESRGIQLRPTAAFQLWPENLLSICYPWSRVPVKNRRSSPWSGVTPVMTSHPPAQYATPGYWGPLAHLVEYDNPESKWPNPERPAL